MEWQSLIVLLTLKAQFGQLYKFKVVFLIHNTTTSDITSSVMEEDSSNFVDDTSLTGENIRRLKKERKKLLNKKLKQIRMKAKIVGGFEVEDIKTYPYHARYGETCGAAIIHKSWVITVAHCGTKPYIVVGTRKLYEGRKIFVKEHVLHPMWRARNKPHYFDYDYQLLQLKQNLIFHSQVKAIKLGDYESLKVGDLITVTGWGLLKFDGPRPVALQAVQVPIVSKDSCQKVNFPFFQHNLTPRMFCAGYVKGDKDACQGDSGGAAAHNNRLIGLVSFGFECATPEAYGVYSDISKVKDWIKSTTGVQ